MLMYLKENPNQSYHGHLFKISQPKVSEWIRYLLSVLEASLLKIGMMPQTGGEFVKKESNSDFLLVDVTKRQVPRFTDYTVQKEEYSGKKKLHTTKNLAITDEYAKVLYISSSEEG